MRNYRAIYNFYYPEDYVYSSAADYADKKGLLDNVIVFQYFGLKNRTNYRLLEPHDAIVRQQGANYQCTSVW